MIKLVAHARSWIELTTHILSLYAGWAYGLCSSPPYGLAATTRRPQLYKWANKCPSPCYSQVNGVICWANKYLKSISLTKQDKWVC
jgi:hypothetical protein